MASILDFTQEPAWGMPVELERRNRIRLSVAAYSYEFLDVPIISDAEFDELASKIDPNMDTGNERMDKFFAEHFNPHTGMWIRQHPEPKRLKQLYELYYKKKRGKQHGTSKEAKV